MPRPEPPGPWGRCEGHLERQALGARAVAAARSHLAPPKASQAPLPSPGRGRGERSFPDPLDEKFQNNGPERVNESETHVLRFSSKSTRL